MRFKLSVESDKQSDLALMHRVMELLNGGTAELSEPAPVKPVVVLKETTEPTPVVTETTVPASGVKRPLNGEEPEPETAAAKRGPGRPRKAAAPTPTPPNPKLEEPEEEAEKWAEPWAADLGDEEFLKTVTDFCKSNRALNESVGNLLRQYSVDRVTHLPVERRREFLSELTGLKVLQ